MIRCVPCFNKNGRRQQAGGEEGARVREEAGRGQLQAGLHLEEVEQAGRGAQQGGVREQQDVEVCELSASQVRRERRAVVTLMSSGGVDNLEEGARSSMQLTLNWTLGPLWRGSVS